MKEGGSSDVKCAYEGSGRKKQGGGGGSPLRVFFRASPLICPLIILGKKRKDDRGQKGLLTVTLWLHWHWKHPHLGGASGHEYNVSNESL